MGDPPVYKGVVGIRKIRRDVFSKSIGECGHIIIIIIRGVGSGVGGALERVVSKERNINAQFQHLAEEYSSIKVQLEEAQTRHTETVNELTNQLQEVAEQLDDIKANNPTPSPTPPFFLLFFHITCTSRTRRLFRLFSFFFICARGRPSTEGRQ